MGQAWAVAQPAAFWNYEDIFTSKILFMSENTKSQPKILLTPFVYTTTHCQKRFKIKHYQQSEYASDGA